MKSKITNIVIEMDMDDIFVYVYREGHEPSARRYFPSQHTYTQVEQALKKLSRRGVIMLNWYNFNPVSGISVISFMPIEYWRKHVAALH